MRWCAFFSLRLSDSMDGDDDAVVHPCKTVIQQPTNCLLSPKSSSSGEEEWWHEQNSARDLITMRRALLFAQNSISLALLLELLLFSIHLLSHEVSIMVLLAAASPKWVLASLAQCATGLVCLRPKYLHHFTSVKERKSFFFDDTRKINWMKSQISPRYLSCRWSFHNIPKSSSTSLFFFAACACRVQ